MASPLIRARPHVHGDDFTCPPYCVRGGGYYPSDFRTAYDVSGHGVTGAGQTIGLTLWGPPAFDADFAAQQADEAKNAGVNDPLLHSCARACGANSVTWIPVGSKTLDKHGNTDVTEASMDAEFSHGIALNSRLHFYLAPNARDSVLVDTLAAAASDPAVHVVSDSWGGGPNTSKTDPFVKATSAVFKKADAVGTTFYFSSGDTSQNSGCPLTPAKIHTQCGVPSYPASSPYVVSVGGTNLQVSEKLTWTWESAWNSDPNNGYAGGGNGCASWFSRPTWQTHVSSAATCSGRAEPDISADGDPETGVAFTRTMGRWAPLEEPAWHPHWLRGWLF